MIQIFVNRLIPVPFSEDDFSKIKNYLAENLELFQLPAGIF